MRRLLGNTWLRVFGWRVEGSRPPVSKAVVVAYPHTSNWDLLFTLAISYSLDLEIHWLGKKAIFKPPFGRFMRWVGGVPVDRNKRTNMVDAVTDAIAPMDDILVIIPPEGTRAQAGRWKSGFYWVAVKSEIPIILGFLDYRRKCGGLGEVLSPSGDIEFDFEKISAFYSNIEGRFPERQGPITLID
jgi:1-acyl-sn-glycerol-3-phosphate acyltransferase